MAVHFDRFVGFLLVIMSVLGITGMLVTHGRLLDLLTVTDANQLFYLICGSILMVIGFECRETMARKATLFFGLVFLGVALLGLMSRNGMVLERLHLASSADIIFAFALAVLAFLCSLPLRRENIRKGRFDGLQ